MCCGLICYRRSPYFYPRSPCGERLYAAGRPGYLGNFYPRSPCGERLLTRTTPTSYGAFLSTLSLRRATLPVRSARHVLANFYPRSPCGERHGQRERNPHALDFYPRSPCGERLPSGGRTFEINLFLSTLSLRRATVKGGE